MPVISRSALESSSLADLHEIASELGLDGYRRLRKADLVGAIIERHGGEAEPDPEDAGAVVDVAVNGDADVDVDVDVDVEVESDADADADVDADAEKPARRSRRGGRGRSRARDRDPGDGDADADEPSAEESEAPPRRSARAARGGRSSDNGERDRGDRGDRDRDRGPAEEKIASGVVELLPNGSGFLRVTPPEPSDDDVYISAAQVRRCELVSGDEVSGPVRAPRRSERYPSLIRVDTINGRSADEVAEGTKYDDLPCAYATERIALDSEDATIKAIEWLTPFGRGSRVVIVGGPRAGKTEALRRLARALTGREDLELSVVLAGVRPEEIGGWRSETLQPIAELGLAAAPDAQGQAIERAIETGRRVAARGGHAVLLIDTLEYVPAPLARRALAAARNIVDGGSLTIVATAREAFGGETTVIALDAALAASGRIPALDLPASGTIKPELLVGDKGADAIAEARAAAMA
ncbi:MAG TPA: Rho termination factor N-terminal domain-containing protein [Solirubrobacteraceae bacterium]|nr:Rho termination factor N-terminal domain-containing protein [Solirubrobacteraceae bacterium]